MFTVKNPWKLAAIVLLIDTSLKSWAGWKLKQTLDQRTKQVKDLYEVTKFLILLIDKNDVTLEPFDVIALRELGFEVEEVPD